MKVSTIQTFDLRDILELEQIEDDMFRANLVFAEEYSLYGGQVAAQALLAAGRTVSSDREPHSLHGYFLRGGDPMLPTVFRVYRDRDGGSYSARRVVAIQRGAVIFNMAASFHRPESGDVSQVEAMPDVPAADALESIPFKRLVSFETRVPEPPYASTRWPTRFWARATVPLAADALTQSCALTYLSDISTGILPSPDGAVQPGSSLDHAVWFHQHVDMTEWTLTDYQPRRSGGGRGWYTGSIYNGSGALVASIAQEALFRTVRPGHGFA